jgi:hypothetical protein
MGLNNLPVCQRSNSPDRIKLATKMASKTRHKIPPIASMTVRYTVSQKTKNVGQGTQPPTLTPERERERRREREENKDNINKQDIEREENKDNMFGSVALFRNGYCIP